MLEAVDTHLYFSLLARPASGPGLAVRFPGRHLESGTAWCGGG